MIVVKKITTRPGKAKYLTSRNGLILSSGDMVFIDRFYSQLEGMLKDYLFSNIKDIHF